MTSRSRPLAANAEAFEGCPFCGEITERREITSNEYAAALTDRYPVSQGHTLVVPIEHVDDLFELAPEAQIAVWQLVSEVRDELYAGGIVAFTIGINVGVAAGQTIDHAHVHVIPRRPGDVKDPRGGVRRVIPNNAALKSDAASTDNLSACERAGDRWPPAGAPR